METNQQIGIVYFNTEVNEYALKCQIYNKLTRGILYISLIRSTYPDIQSY